MTKFEKLPHAKKTASISRRGTVISADIHVAAVEGHEDYVQARINNPDDAVGGDFDAVARLLNAVKSISLRTSDTVAAYHRAHGPYLIEYTEDKKNKRKKRWYCKLDKAETANPFIPMDIPWDEWDSPKAEKVIKNEGDLLKLVERIANDTDNKAWDKTAVSDAVVVLHALKETIAARPVAA